MRLREYAAQAWVMFEAINKKLYVADAVKFKNRYNNFNLNSDVDLIKTFRGAKILKMLTRKLNAKNLLTKKMGLSSQIYFQLDGEAILNDLLGKVDGFKTTDYDDLLPQQTIAYLKQKYPKLTDIYSNFEFILFLIKKLNEKTIDYNEGNIFVDFDECINGEEIDIYLAASEFLDEINDVLQDELDKRFVEDLLYFRENLKDALIFSKQVYINCGYNV